VRAGPALHCEESGPADAPLIVLVHGALDRSAGFAKVARRLNGEHRVLRYDRRGYGRSQACPGPYTVATNVADLLDLLAGRQAIVVGHSYGGDIALAAAAARPDAIRAVGVYEPPMPWTSWWPAISAGSAAVSERGDPELTAEHFMRRMIGDDRWAALPERTRMQRRAEGVALVAEVADLSRQAPFTPDAVRPPVVVARGGAGTAHHAESVQRLVAVLPDAELYEIAGAGHGAHMSHPAEFAAFVRRVAGRAVRSNSDV
jgi:pimeloyl-ACP methyl ester carboxylesterase